MMVGDDHGNLLPPHSIARSNMMMAGAKTAKPMRSRFLMREGIVRGIDFFLCWLGMLMLHKMRKVMDPRRGLR